MMATSGDGGSSRIADDHQWAVIRLRLTSLVLTVAIALVSIRLDAPLHALWVLLVLPVFWVADVRLSGLAESHRAHALLRHLEATADGSPSPSISHDIDGVPGSQAQWSSYRAEFYTLLTFAPIVVVLQG